jgi:hypothetical protein
LTATGAATELEPMLDHVVYAGPSLDRLIEEISDRTGVGPTHGGAHDGLGTHNALLGLGQSQYLELLAPIPSHEERSAFARVIAGLTTPKLYMWAVRVTDVEEFVARGKEAGLAMGNVVEMSRTPPVGSTQHWKLSLGGADVYNSVLPFGIAWTPPGHPSQGLAAGCRLTGMRAEHPEPERVRDALETLGVALPVRAADAASLILEIDAPAGAVELR